MEKKVFTHLFSIVVIGLVITSCGSNNIKELPTTGRVIDDYISGASVCADVNNNKIADDGVENCVKTDKEGRFHFLTTRTEPLVMSGGVDIGTGKAFTGTFLAPPKSKVINPLTTLVHGVQDQGNKTLEEAQEIVKNKLGLKDTDVDLTTFDPLLELQFGESSEVKEVAQQVLAQQTNIQIILTITASTIASSSSKITESNVSVEASSQIAQLMLEEAQDNDAPQINSEESIQMIIKETAQETFSEETEEHSEALASIEAVQSIVAQQVQETTQTVITNIETIQVTTEDTGLTAIKESNAGVLLVTDTQSDTSIVNIIEHAVATGDTSVLGAVDIATEIENSSNELISRPPLQERREEEIVIRPTGGEGGTS
jgi:hypothetical protein